MATKHKKAKKKAVKRTSPKAPLWAQALVARFENVEAVVQGILDALSKAVGQKNESMTALREAIERLDRTINGDAAPSAHVGLGEAELAQHGVTPALTDAELLS